MVFDFITRQTSDGDHFREIRRLEIINLFPVIKNNLVDNEYKDDCKVETVVIRRLTKQDGGLYQQRT
jgi:hypothetical protein